MPVPSGRKKLKSEERRLGNAFGLSALRHRKVGVQSRAFAKPDQSWRVLLDQKKKDRNGVTLQPGIAKKPPT
jgi:hypothetical protein